MINRLIVNKTYTYVHGKHNTDKECTDRVKASFQLKNRALMHFQGPGEPVLH